MTALAAVIAVVAAVLGVSVIVAAGAALLCVTAWRLYHTWGETPVAARWRTWAYGRSVVERELRLLGAEWRILWDRRVWGLPTPAIVAIGPSGAWALWWPEPGIEAQADCETAASAVNEASGLPAGAYVLQGPPAQVPTFVHEMACAPRVASHDDIARAAEQLHTMLLQEPVGVGL